MNQSEFIAITYNLLKARETVQLDLDVLLKGYKTGAGFLNQSLSVEIENA